VGPLTIAVQLSKIVIEGADQAAALAAAAGMGFDSSSRVRLAAVKSLNS